MRAIGRGVSKSLDSINGLTSEATAAKTVAKLQSHLRSTAESLAALTPPAPIKAQHAQLVKAVRDLADELDTVIARLKGGKLDAAAVFATIVGLKSVAEIQSASTAIANRGYSIGSG
jgi:hypothetical protein